MINIKIIGSLRGLTMFYCNPHSLNCIGKHGAERERVKFAVYEMVQLFSGILELEAIASP